MVNMMSGTKSFAYIFYRATYLTCEIYAVISTLRLMFENGLDAVFSCNGTGDNFVSLKTKRCQIVTHKILTTVFTRGPFDTYENCSSQL